jgi:hypothetical protein
MSNVGAMINILGVIDSLLVVKALIPTAPKEKGAGLARFFPLPALF